MKNKQKEFYSYWKKPKKTFDKSSVIFVDKTHCKNK